MSVQDGLNQHTNDQVFRDINEKSERIMAFALMAYFIFGLGLSFVYDTL